MGFESTQRYENIRPVVPNSLLIIAGTRTWRTVFAIMRERELLIRRHIRRTLLRIFGYYFNIL